MRRASAVMSLFLASCSGMLVDDHAGRLLPDGRISPCGTFHANPQACGNARWNAKAIRKVSIGLTIAEVRSVMAHDADSREVTESEERWSYLTDYDRDSMSVIVFRHGRV